MPEIVQSGDCIGIYVPSANDIIFIQSPKFHSWYNNSCTPRGMFNIFVLTVVEDVINIVRSYFYI